MVAEVTSHLACLSRRPESQRAAARFVVQESELPCARFERSRIPGAARCYALDTGAQTYCI